MAPRLRIKSFRSTDGDTVQLDGPGVTVIVGGNNAGKSRLLRDIKAQLSTNNATAVVLTELQIDRPAWRSTDLPNQIVEATAWLERRAFSAADSRNGQKLYSNGSSSDTVTAQDLASQIALQGYPLWLLSAAPFFVKLVRAGGLTDYATKLGTAGSLSPSDPTSALYSDGDLEMELSRLAVSTFQTGLTFDRVNVPPQLRVGTYEGTVPPFSHPTPEYSAALEFLPTLADQGEGMKSFVGLALMLSSRPADVILIDEPEAFLHPPQAKALGRWVAKQAIKKDIQVIMATHDRDFVLGLISSDVPVTIVRIVREGSNNTLRHLSASQVAIAWNDAILKYSNVIQGLFHSTVVLCESDSDCRFYSAALDALCEATNRQSAADDCLFVPTGGKGDSVKFVRALANIGVNSIVIFDFDGLNDQKRLKSIVEAKGGSWTPALECDWGLLNTAVTQGPKWEIVKKLGLASIPAGKARQATDRLVEALKGYGVVFVPVGEMEDFDRSIANQKAPWVNEALQKSVHTEEGPKTLVGQLI